MKIKLIAPSAKFKTGLNSSGVFKIKRVCLPLLAALTPPGHTIRIVDEDFAPDDLNESFDLVGITVMTEQALRAYHIAELYRKRGTKVVLGGVHPTLLPDEAINYADSIVIGEAEEVWPKLVNDAASGKLQKVYRAARPPDLKGLPLPKRDLYPKLTFKSYTPLTTGIETSRGCPYNCEFCSVSRLTGRQLRYRPIHEVIAELESLGSINAPLLFVDENLGLNREIFKGFLTQLIPFQHTWLGQGTISLAEDIDLIKLLYRSGCQGLLIGFESVQSRVQEGMAKTKNKKIDYSEAVRRFHGEGIPVVGAFILGFDYENKNIFPQTYEFIMKNSLDFAQIRLLTPYPGTELYNRLLSEKRLFAHEWWLHGYSTRTLLFRPKNMTPGELIDGFTNLSKQFNTIGNIVKRFFGIPPWKRKKNGCLAYVAFNLGQLKRFKKGMNAPQPFF
jgi:radical SAM superfamily enzyme YgiQ (UPF0313 family)